MCRKKPALHRPSFYQHPSPMLQLGFEPSPCSPLTLAQPVGWWVKGRGCVPMLSPGVYPLCWTTGLLSWLWG